MTKETYKIKTLNDNNRMSTQELLQLINEKIEEGQTENSITRGRIKMYRVKCPFIVRKMICIILDRSENIISTINCTIKKRRVTNI